MEESNYTWKDFKLPLVGIGVKEGEFLAYSEEHMGDMEEFATQEMARVQLFIDEQYALHVNQFKEAATNHASNQALIAMLVANSDGSIFPEHIEIVASKKLYLISREMGGFNE